MAIIEVERKFILRSGEHLPWNNNRELLFTDQYFDTSSYKLTGQNWWLRKRWIVWELKVGRFGQKNTTTMYEEITGEKSIADRLGLVLSNKRLNKVLKECGYFSFAELKTLRRFSSVDYFTITDDDVSTEDDRFHYRVIEIELMVPEEEKDAAVEQINDFAKSLDLDDRPVRGKLIEYLRLYRPDHFKFLLDRGVIAPELAV